MIFQYDLCNRIINFPNQINQHSLAVHFYFQYYQIIIL